MNHDDELLTDDEKKLRQQRWDEYTHENLMLEPLLTEAKKAFAWAYNAAMFDEREQWEAAKPEFEDGQP